MEDQAFAYWNAAINAVERGKPKQGLQLADEARALLETGNDLRARARLHVTRAWVHLAQEPPEATEARALLRDALPHLRQYSGSGDVAAAEVELARSELLLGRPEVARRHAQSAIKRLGPRPPHRASTRAHDAGLGVPRARRGGRRASPASTRRLRRSSRPRPRGRPLPPGGS